MWTPPPNGARTGGALVKVPVSYCGGRHGARDTLQTQVLDKITVLTFLANLIKN